jgi:hypothetical protein
MDPDNGCKDRNSCEGEKEVPMNAIFSYDMDLQDKKQ